MHIPIKMKKKKLIIPDVHQKIHKVKNILKKADYDEVISLGDWFDDFGDTADQAEATAEYLLELQNTLGDRFVWLLGNHDIPYVFPESTDLYWCSGVTEEKIEKVHEVFREKLDTQRLRLFHIIETKGRVPIVLSHAGVHPKQFHNRVTIKGMRDAEQFALLEASLGRNNLLLQAGRCRGGREPIGGVTWLDWYYEFEPIKRINQIVGHTTQRNGYSIVNQSYENIYATYQTTESGANVDIYEFGNKDNFNLCLDTHLQHYAIIEDNKLKVYEYDI